MGFRLFGAKQGVPIEPAHEHAFGPWAMERRVLIGPYGRTEDDVMRRRCADPECGTVQEKEIERTR